MPMIITTPHFRAKGFSLIEVLVALVVLSIGLIGLAAIQQTGVRNNHNALLHSQASILAYEVADLMRSNIDGVQSNSYDRTATPEQQPDCITKICSEQQMADFHLTRWYQNLATALPRGSGTVTCDGTPCDPGSTLTITVSWQESGIGGVSSQTFTTDVQL